MKRIKFFDDVIEIVKKKAKADDMPEILINTPKGLVVSVLVHPKKYQMQMALESFRLLYNNPEMVLVTDSWTVKGDPDKIKIMPSEHPDRKECFTITYFSKNKVLVHHILYKRLKKKEIRWTKENEYWKCKDFRSIFNPYRFKKKDMERWLELSKQDVLREKGKKETHKLPFKFKVDVYRHKGKVFFEVSNNKGETFQSTLVSSDTKEFNDKLKFALDMLTGKADISKFIEDKKIKL